MEQISPMDQKFIQKLTRVIEENLGKEDFGVNEIAAQLGISRSTLHRKVKSIIKKSVSEYIRETRLKHAHQLLQHTNCTVAEIAFQVGFGSVPYFNRCFLKQYGYPPGEVLKGLHLSDESTTNDQKKKKPLHKKYIYAIGVVFVFILTVFVFLRKTENNTSHKNIAVIPIETNDNAFRNEPEINWIGVEIIDRLNQISNLSVVPYSSIRYYKTEHKSSRKIGRELLVQYILYGKLIRLGNQIKIHFELVDVLKDTTIWSNIYTEQIENLNLGKTDAMSENVVLQIIKTLPVNPTGYEKHQISKTLTENQSALESYKLARKMLLNPDIGRKDAFDAKKLLENAVKLDTSFSEAYSLLGKIYYGQLRYTPDIYLAEKYIDSSLLFLKKALNLNENNQEAIIGLYNYFNEKGKTSQAEEMKSKITFKPIKNYLYYQQEIGKYASQNDYYHQIESFYNYLDILPEDVIVPWWVHENLYQTFRDMGFPDQARFHADKRHNIQFKTALQEDSFDGLLIDELNGNYETGFYRAQRMIQNNKWTGPGENFYMVRYWERKGDYKEACKYLDKMEQTTTVPWGDNWLEMLSDTSRLIYPFGYCYLKNGQEEKAAYYFNRFIKKYSDEIKLNAYFARKHYTYLEISMVYSAMGNNVEAFSHLNKIKGLNACPLWFILELKNSPWFSTIRYTPEFEKLLKELESRYKKEHQKIERVIRKRA